MGSRNIIIVKTGDTIDDLIEEHGDFEDWIAKGLAVDPEDIRVVNAVKGDPLPGPEEIKGVVIAGSHDMVTDEKAWSLEIESWVPGIIRERIPLLGICYGHQLLAKAMGGAVDFHPKGSEAGTTDLYLTEAAHDDPLFKDMPGKFKIHTSHSQSVVRLPEGAVLLGKNDFEPHHAFRFGASAWGFQFHPEYNTTIVARYVEEMAESIRETGRDENKILDEVTDTPEALAVLNRFGHLCMTTGA